MTTNFVEYLHRLGVERSNAERLVAEVESLTDQQGHDLLTKWYGDKAQPIIDRINAQ